MFVAFLQHSLNSNALTWIKLKWREEKKNRQTPKHEEEIILTQFEFVRFCEELFRAHRNRRSIYCSENSSFGSLSWYAVMYNKKNESTWLVWLVFPTYQLHITSLLFITASWKIMPHTIPSRETETQLNKEFNVFFVVVVVAIAIAIACCRKRHNTNF